MSRNTEDEASPQERGHHSQDIKYQDDESLRNVVQTAPPYPSTIGPSHSASPPSPGIQEDHIRKKARLEYESGAASLTSPSVGGYDSLLGPGRAPQGYISGPTYGYAPTSHASYSGHYGQPTYGIPASAPALRDSHNIHLSSNPAVMENSESGFPPSGSDFPVMHQSRMSSGSMPSPGAHNYPRGPAQGNGGGYPAYPSLPQNTSSGTYPSGSGSLGPPSGIGPSDSPHTPLMTHDSRSWSHAYSVPAAVSPTPNLSMPTMARQAPMPRPGPQYDQQSTYYSRSYPPYDERGLPVGMVTSPYQQSAPQFLSPESAPSVFRGELPYPSSGSSTTRPTGPTSTSASQTGAKSQALFVSKLYNMLEDAEIVASGLLKWSADGQGFVCTDPNEFARLFLSKYFKHANWHSFVRQLNMYGFNKQVNDVFQTLSQPADQPVAWEFRHAIFRRGDPTCVQRIKRRSVKSNSIVHRDLASSQIARPQGLPTAQTSTPVVYSATYQPVSYVSDTAMQASHPMMGIPRYSGGDPYGMPGGYSSGPSGSTGPGGPPQAWMPGPSLQYSRPHPYPPNPYMPPPDSNPSNSQRSTSTLPSRTTESYTRHDRPGRPY